MTDPRSSTTSGRSNGADDLFDASILSSLCSVPATFDDQVGSVADFYGAIADERLFKLGDAVWEVLEERTRGYGSQLDEVVSSTARGLFPETPLARVRLVARDDGFNDVYELNDVETGHTWLRFGTKDYYDDEPEFIFEYTPLEVPR